ncbi:hypothetical protein BJI69_18405 [Luteibacter rhizovicinus DSM 16549]|uniref:Uncharacterized protein n=1 Tax=Luteibacter rhizovicinus DSM 16549 TaxID=1440763 RepID=A0A0G9HBT2_9GAMM|nr:hypothetical protein [Luteibacter rhizovicinus]APG05678.1 hypothetical protein BJI69_18405 [Luteibacter rhizovicinus DSM 16549]KLD66941.1 hypothetical protein Y883_10150 [Luteibacter rhizovicinus DSM 16549]KLD73146.1 hypothetical protein Y886_39545 [Xanthomonas hyacinthi DSM 19077]
MSGLPPLDELLAYDRHLEGEAFTRRVMGRAARRGHRGWILGGSILLALAVVLGIKPDHFTMFADIQLPWHVLSDVVATVPTGGLVVALAVVALMVGAGKTVDSL